MANENTKSRSSHSGQYVVVRGKGARGSTVKFG